MLESLKAGNKTASLSKLKQIYISAQAYTSGQRPSRMRLESERRGRYVIQSLGLRTLHILTASNFSDGDATGYARYLFEEAVIAC